MRFLITMPGIQEPFYSEWFTIENHYTKGMIVYNLQKHEYYSGEEWKPIEEDHL